MCYLTHTGLVNEAGIQMTETIGRYPYRFVVVNLSETENIDMVVLCNDSLEAEKLNEFITYQLNKDNFISKLSKDQVKDKTEVTNEHLK